MPDSTSQKLIELQKAVDLDSGNVEAWYNLGTTHGILGNYEKSAEAFKKVVDLDPTLAT